MKMFDKKNSLFLIPIVLVHVIFFMLALHFKKIFMGDSEEYVSMALNIKDHFLFYSANVSLPISVKNYTLRPPAYSLFLLVFYLFGANNWVIIFFQNILSIFNIFYLRKTMYLFGFQKKYDWLFILFVIVYPAQFIFTNSLASEILLQTFVLIYFKHFLLLIKERKSKDAWLSSLALTLGFFTKPILYPFVAIHLLMLFVLSLSKKSYKYYWLAALLPICAILSYDSWNYARTDKFHFSSIQPINALNCTRFFWEHKIGKERSDAIYKEEKQKTDTMSFKEWYDSTNEYSMGVLKQNFFSYIKFHSSFFPIFFIHPGKGEIDLFTGTTSYDELYQNKTIPVRTLLKSMSPREIIRYMISNPTFQIMLLILFFNCIKCVGFLFFLFNRNINIQFRLFTCVLLFYFAFITGPVVDTRFHIPVSLIFIGVSVLGMQSFFQKRKNRLIS